MNSGFDKYLSTHFERIGAGGGQKLRADALRANYLRLLAGVDRAAAVLEIGPGTGELLVILRNEAKLPNVTAIDLSPEVVSYCNERFGGVQLVKDSRAFLEEHASTYDLIILLHVLEHVPKSDTIAFLAAINKALRPNGRAVIEVPNMGNPISGLTSRYADFTHEVGFTESSLRQVLQMASFADLEVRPFLIPRTSAARWVQWLLRGLLEKMFFLLSMLYSRTPEINSANLVAIARKSGPDTRSD